VEELFDRSGGASEENGGGPSRSRRKEGRPQADDGARPRREQLSAEQRRLRARIGGFAVHSRHDSRDLTAPARAAFLRRFEEQVDPDRQLPAAERERRATAARRAYFAALAYRSSKARRARRRST